MIYRNRAHAGRRLADLLLRHDVKDPVVLGLTRGGVPVAYEVARRLGAPLDVLVARKVGAPGRPELAIGAVAPGSVVISDEIVGTLHVSPVYLDRAIEREQRTVERRLRTLREFHPAVSIRGRSVILVDDGIATGQTMLAALASVRARGAVRVIVAVPVAAGPTVRRLEKTADAVVCGAVIEDLAAVGMHYEDFSPLSDLEVRGLLRRAQLERAAHHWAGAEPP